MKKKFIYFIVFSLLFFIGFKASAQSTDDHNRQQRRERFEKIQSAKVAFMTEKMNLSPEDAQRFWPVYNQLEEERRTIRHKNRELRDEKIASLSDQQIREALNQRLQLKQTEVNIDRVFMDKFLKVISPKQLAAFYGAEREFTDLLLKKLDSQRTANK